MTVARHPTNPTLSRVLGLAAAAGLAFLPHDDDRAWPGAAAAAAAAAEQPPGRNTVRRDARASGQEFRPSDTRPVHNETRLKNAGIAVYESKRLRLYTDIPPEAARALPPLADRAYEALVEYFGPLPPNREGTEYQVTGYVMADKELFRRVGLLPKELPEFEHGQHLGAEFWMNDQPYDYYRRHLMVHEFTHCYMLLMPDARIPVWYVEGMAELFGVHRVDAELETQFRLMPDSKDNFAGFRRIEVVREDAASGRLRSVSDIENLKQAGFVGQNGYVWSWALCKFLDSHPRYRERFRALSREIRTGAFQERFHKTFAADWNDLETEWAIFASNLEYGFDAERAAIDFQSGRPLAQTNEPVRFRLASNRGWQSSGWKIEAGKEYLATATGRIVLDDKPKPWVAEPQGVSILYENGRPLGMVLAAVHSDAPAASPREESMLEGIPVGREARFKASVTGTLYFRVNDFWGRLADNEGDFEITLRHVAKEK